MTEPCFYCYENGSEETFTLSDLHTYFDTCPDLQVQKDQGTIFDSWLKECIHMQIFLPSRHD